MGKLMSSLSLWLIITLLPILMCFDEITAKNISTDEDALLALKAHITNDPQNLIASNWSTATSVCNWIGITCGTRHRRVRGIQLRNMSLTGTIPPHIGNLSFLVNFSLAYNSFHGPLPVELANLRRLKLFRLGYNLFNGIIPSWIGSFTQLQYFSLHSNNFTGVIPTSLCNLSKLEHLNLGMNNLEGQIPEVIGNTGGGGFCNMGTIPKEIGNLSSLINLNLGRNNLKGFIPKAIGNLRKLQGLNLSSNRIQGTIPSELCNLQSLSMMNLGKNELFGNLPSCLGNLISLRNLYLNSNRFNSTFPSTLWRLKDVLELNLSSNSFSGDLPLDIGNLKVVTLLDFSGNQLSGSISPSFGGLQSLIQLSLSNNKLEGSIPDSFDGALSLKYMDLSINNLSGEIPKSLEKLKDLENFNVSFNELQGEIPNGGPFTNFSARSFLGNKALCGDMKFLVHPCKASHWNKSKEAKIVLVVIGTTVLTLATLTILIWYCKRKTRLSTHPNNSLALATWQRISIHELNQATTKFDETNLLGRGSFGSVYKGTLSNGMFVAVKVFNLEVEGAFKSFDVECEVLRKIRHRNLAKIITSCCTTEFKALVMEFMPNWSLEKWLYSHNYFLNLLQRLNIMTDVASALEYLHYGTTESIVHCDLKPSNILLDGDMFAHVTDFGIAKLVGGDQSVIQTMTLATVGYMAPEYGEGLVSVNGDIYSFGILLMETFTRRRPTDEMFNEEMSMKQWIKEMLPSGVAQLADPNLIRVNEQHYLTKTDCILTIMDLAVKCCADVPEERVNSKEVVSALNKIKVKLLKDVHQAQ